MEEAGEAQAVEEQPVEEQAGAAEGTEYAAPEYDEAAVQYDEAGQPYYPDAAYAEPPPEGAEVAAVVDERQEEVPVEPVKKRGGHGRRKIEIEYIDDKIRRHITFSKRKAGISKKAYELSRLTGAQVLLLISSERGQIYSFATPKLQPILVNEASKTLIEQCLNAPDPIAPLALGMPGMPQAMLPIDGSMDPNDPNADPNDPNAPQHYAEYAAQDPQYAHDGSIDPQQADADQLLAMHQAAQAAHYQGMPLPEGMEYAPGMEHYQQYQDPGQYGQQYAEQYAEGYEQGQEGQNGQEGYEGQEQAEVEGGEQ